MGYSCRTGLAGSRRSGVRALRRGSKYWVALKTKQVSSRDARSNIQSQGFEYLHPEFRRRERNGVRRCAPLFPFYLLVCVDETERQNWKALSSTKGVSYVLTMSETPSIVPNEFIHRMREAIDGSEDGYYPDPAQAYPRFNSGDVVEGVRGLFEEKFGKYVGLAGSDASRVRVLFSILGRDAEFEVRADDLRAVV